MDTLAIILLAAGKGTRMKSDTAKVLHPVAGRPMLFYPLKISQAFSPQKLVVVVGHQAGQVEQVFSNEDLFFVRQEQQLGSGHAVAVTEETLRDFAGTVLIMCGDVPLIRVETITRLLNEHRQRDATVSVLTVNLQDPAGYGRVVRDAAGMIQRIVEHRDATGEQRRIQEINTGIYCCQSSFLYAALKNIEKNNDQGEYYLPDIIHLAVKEGKQALAVLTEDAQEVAGINDRIDLAEAERVMRERILKQHLQDGVTIIDPASTYIDYGVTIGPDTVIYPNASIRGKTVIGSSCTVDANCTIIDSIIGNRVHIKPSCVIDTSRISDSVLLGPFAHLRPQTVVEEGGRIGNFVEVKKSRIGKGSKANHLSYIGDTTIGEGVNIGAGTITCNYDGKTKHPTVIKDHVFVGSNTSLVAPVTIGEGAVIGAGSTITKDVPAGSLAVGRTRQTNYEHWYPVSRKKREGGAPDKGQS
ncbi:MAG: bifunctional UDP-N-acetylglucosamine diphosphorylase/glucosamine-1-phosphate N-acetyltransferase GlmU [Proteobacteria bacterium]|nr:bifunctional UDP-N-acetylglucosamine diphosphorylase/glucosamine-1-phosphate N-acetyltransferase GlmU [Pseudomonadota bacterium]